MHGRKLEHLQSFLYLFERLSPHQKLHLKWQVVIHLAVSRTYDAQMGLVQGQLELHPLSRMNHQIMSADSSYLSRMNG